MSSGNTHPRPVLAYCQEDPSVSVTPKPACFHIAPLPAERTRGSREKARTGEVAWGCTCLTVTSGFYLTWVSSSLAMEREKLPVGKELSERWPELYTIILCFISSKSFT